MRTNSFASASICWIALLAFACSAGAGPTVDVDASTQQATADLPLQVVTKPTVRGRQIDFAFVNQDVLPVKATLKIHNVAGASFDLYVNGEFIGASPRAEVESGLEIPIPGGYLDSGTRKMLESLNDPLYNAYIEMTSTGEDLLLAATFRSRSTLLKGILAGDRSARSAQVMLIESGLPPLPSGSQIETLSKQQVEQRLPYLLERMKTLRAAISNSDADAERKAIWMGWTIPLTLQSEGQVALTNHFDQPIKGKITLGGAETEVCRIAIDPGKTASCSADPSVSLVVEGTAGQLPFTKVFNPSRPGTDAERRERGPLR